MILVLACLAAKPAAAETEWPFAGGSYAVTYRLELPHVERWAMTKKATLCVPEARDAGHTALPILSGNTPFAKCPARNFARDGAQLSYDVVCEGRAAAKARAVYKAVPGGFEGRILMVMAAKNMTMTEVQSGRRVGPCTAVSMSRHR